ncbi:MAG: sodium-dependent transporter [Wolinella sp.]
MSRFSRIGFILAAAGSAIGLGNVWKFPYMAGENGGGAFVIIFLMSVLFVGLTIFLAEVVMGRESEHNPVSTFESLAPKNGKYWKYAGFMMINGILILSFYSVVIGWLIHYMVQSFVALPTGVEEASKTFGTLTSTSIFTQIFFHTLIIIYCGYTLLKGVKKGIERINIILMPLLFIIFIALLFYALSMDSFGRAVEFMFTPNWDSITPEVVMMSVGQAFFTLSLGVGTIMTYAASLPKRGNFVTASLYVGFLDTLLAIIAGLTIFTFLYEYGSNPGGGPGLVFISLPVVFSEMGAAGQVVSFLFFLALLFAGVTSAISMAEPFIAYFIERHDWKRHKAVYVVLGVAYIMGILVVLSGSEQHGEIMKIAGKSIFDWLDFSSSALLMPIAGMITCFFIGFVLDKNHVHGMFSGYMSPLFFQIWLFCVRFVAPMAIFTILFRGLFA